MEYAYICVIRGYQRPKRWWNLPREATFCSVGTTEPMPGRTYAEVLCSVIRDVQRQHPELLESYVVSCSLTPDTVLVPIPEQPPVVDTGVIPAVTETDRSLAELTQAFKPLTPDQIPAEHALPETAAVS